MRKLISYAFLMLASLLLGFGLFRVLPNEQLPLIAVILPSFINLTLWWIESFAPYRADWKPPTKILVRDILVTSLVLPIFSGLALISVQRTHDWIGIGTGFSMWPLWAQFLILAVAADFTYYWFHRLSHHAPFFWRFHHTHHSVKHVYWANSGFFHPVDAFFQSFSYFVPLLFLSVDPFVLTCLLAFSAVTGPLEHANVDLKPGRLVGFFNPAELHRWHHGSETQYHHRNFGKAFIFWDRLFGTYHHEKDASRLTVGV